MSWKITIQINSKFTLNNGFEIIETQEKGMFKSCRLKYGEILELNYIYEKGPISADLFYDQKRFDVIHFANYENNEQPKYQFPDFYWKNGTDSDDEYIKYFDSILENEFDNILDCLFKMDEAKWVEFEKYYQSENLRLTGL
ncbi:hypothetical protein A9996_18530 [Gelidibacter algens]|uniref:hypothetical protein n=1 Tax=Gelidibacter algens TaxID=49280 RepID=UPI0008055213|nr:hypothetical protein [Gelidibacter algens]OBX21084.1 hypothetical protein A9996_18530 [Gelidibacter algens]